MKKKTIWLVAIVMGLLFCGLLYMQVTYMRQMTQMKREQFDESVNRALYQAARNLELNETLRYLEKDVRGRERTGSDSTAANDSTANVAQGSPTSSTAHTSFQLKASTTAPASMPKGIILNNDRNAISEASRLMKENIRNRYIYQKALLDEVVYSILYTASDQSLKQRINFRQLDQDLKAELINNGINMPYHFMVLTSDNRVVYCCPDYTPKGSEEVYEQTIFPNDTEGNGGILRVHFPDMSSYVYDGVRFMIPSLVFTAILLFVFVFTIIVVFRQKKVSEMKNDFINNMTHELKTPISSISLAAQMLNDRKVAKTETMMAHLGSVINSESKRLRFLVEKVLQMSMFDRHRAIYNKKEIDLNETVESIASTFKLRVEHTGGHIMTDIEAVDSTICVDEMHFQNVIFNLLDNAVKYCRENTPVELFIKTWNPDEEHVSVMIQDNGVGIKKEDLKKIFEKFYRVHTGNVHDVKGFGLGLAYVKQIVDIHDGIIDVESEYKKGTTFTITLKIVTT